MTGAPVANKPVVIPVQYDVAPHAPGIYFGMDEETYHADPSLGSSNHKDLAKNPSAFWWNSWMNPRKPADKDTPATIRGRAVHQLVLYGEEVFDQNFMRGAIHTDDMSSAEKGAATKAANAAAAKAGKLALNADVYDNIAIASAMIGKNPELATALRNGLNEVSIFWRRKVRTPGGAVVEIPLKCRIDCLKPRGVGDLKSIANKYDKAFDRACIDNITNYRYDQQAQLYLEGRSLVGKFVAEGRVHGDHDADLLKKVAASNTWAWQFVFWCAEGAPITDSLIISPENPILEVARASNDKARAHYAAFMERYGAQEMWLVAEKPRELYIEDLPPWFSR